MRADRRAFLDFERHRDRRGLAVRMFGAAFTSSTKATRSDYSRAFAFRILTASSRPAARATTGSRRRRASPRATSTSRTAIPPATSSSPRSTASRSGTRASGGTRRSTARASTGMFCFLDPEHRRARHRLGARRVGQGPPARDRSRARRRREKLFETWLNDKNVAASALDPASRVRADHLLRRDGAPDGRRPPRPPAPRGPRDPARPRGGLRTIWEADVEAFRDHWGYVEPTEEALPAVPRVPVQRPDALEDRVGRRRASPAR